MQAAVVERLVEKAHFEPSVAVSIAEAMALAMTGSQLVTVSILEGRLADTKVELIRWMLVVMMSQIAITTGIMYFLLQAVG